MIRSVAVSVLLSICAVCFAGQGMWVVQTSRRADVNLTIYLQSGRVLVHETYRVHLPEGTSEVRFEWQDAQIDADTVSLNGPQEVQIGELRRPSGNSKAFVWEVTPDTAGVYDLTASFVLNGLSFSVFYDLIHRPGAETASLVGALRLKNESKLPVRNAVMRLCASPATLVQKVRQAAANEPLPAYATFEGFTLEPGWQRMVEFLNADDIPASIVYRADPVAKGQAVHKHVVLDTAVLPVEGPLPKGHVEAYQRSGDKTVPFLSGDLQPATDGQTDIDIGPEPNLVYERKLLKTTKSNVEFDAIGRVSGHDSSQQICDTFRNRLAEPVQIELRESVAGKWDYTAEVPPTAKTDDALEWDFELAPHQQQRIVFTITRHIGSRAE